MEDFLLRAYAGGLGVAVIAGVLGCFVVWRRMAYFGDSLAHSALLGIALGVLLGINITLSIALICLCFAVLLLWLQHEKILAVDTILGILAHSLLALGVIAISLSDQANIDLHGFLFGSILTVSNSDLWWLYVGGILIMAVLMYFWQPLLLLSFNSDLAAAEGINVFRLRLILILLMTLTVAVSIRMIGVLLMASLLIIPAAGARLLARSPEAMALLAVLFSVLAVVLGLQVSLAVDVPSGPAIVSAAALLFIIIAVASAIRRK